MAITRKMLVTVAVAVVGLFVLANPLGDSHHGLGKHNAFYADLGQGVWIAFLVGAVVFLALVVVALIQRGLRHR